MKKTLNWTHVFLFLLVGLNLLLLFLLWQGRPPGPGALPQGGPIPRAERMLERELQLSEAQREHFRELRRRHFQQMRLLADSIGRVKVQLVESTFESQGQKQEKELRELNRLQLKREKMLLEHFRKLAAACNPEQQDKLRELLTRGTRGGPPMGGPPFQ